MNSEHHASHHNKSLLLHSYPMIRASTLLPQIPMLSPFTSPQTLLDFLLEYPVETSHTPCPIMSLILATSGSSHSHPASTADSPAWPPISFYPFSFHLDFKYHDFCFQNDSGVCPKCPCPHCSPRAHHSTAGRHPYGHPAAPRMGLREPQTGSPHLLMLTHSNSGPW